MARVEGRVAVVTGGGQGIGAEVARRLAQGGATIAVLDIDEAAAKTVANRDRARPVRHHGERDRPRLRRNRDDAGERFAGRNHHRAVA
jgi:NAD(P)-dependent dehydrogenase (short-subunit alcohol dehydrogenase family)